MVIQHNYYDAQTEHGIPYLTTLYKRSFEYKTVVDDLDGLYVARQGVIAGGGSVTSYTIGSRSLSKQTLSASEILKLWDKLMIEKRRLELGKSSNARKAVGVVLRDW